MNASSRSRLASQPSPIAADSPANGPAEIAALLKLVHPWVSRSGGIAPIITTCSNV